MQKLKFREQKYYDTLLSLFDNYYTYLPNNPVDVPKNMESSIRDLKKKVQRYARLGFKSMSISSDEIDTFKFIDRNLDYTSMSEEQKDFAITFTIL